MWSLLASAAAAGLPWECPTFTEPPDAFPYFEAIVSVWPEYAAVAAEVDALTPADCVLEDTWSYGSVTCTSGTMTITRTWAKDRESTEILDGSGHDWTRLYVESYSNSGWSSWGDWSSQYSRAEWTGSFSDFPPDAWVQYGSSWSTDWATAGSHEGEDACTSTCCMSWDSETEGGDGRPVVTTFRVGGDQDVEVSWIEAWGDGTCTGSTSTVDGVSFGPVDDAWEVVGVDPDSDGYIDACDCDETDPDINAGEHDEYEDGVDQDCDGIDGRLDGDGDGHLRPSAGGDDCDDDDRRVYPGADDAAGDRMDQDCDGTDDVDADGDGFTVDGDDQPPDCDDTDTDARPGAPESAGDGIDQDCDGADDVDTDGDGFTVDGDDDLPDCDDTDPDTWPGADEIPDDGIDQDCDGADEVGDHDRDGDGFDAVEWAGTDCDDTEPATNPDAEDTDCDGVDTNCDGEDCPPPEPTPEMRVTTRGCASSPLIVPPWLALLLLARRRPPQRWPR